MRNPLSHVAMVAALALALIAPLAFGPAVSRALAALHVSGPVALLLVAGMLLGSTVNIPIWLVAGRMLVPVAPLPWLDVDGFGPAWRHNPSGTVVAVNLGGFVVPCVVAAYETFALGHAGSGLGPIAISVTVATGICYVLAKPVAGVGMVMPAVIPPFVAAISALNLAPDAAAPVALAAGTIGALVGADLLHLRDAAQSDAGLVVVGGAGTFDGVLLSSIVALFLA